MLLQSQGRASGLQLRMVPDESFSARSPQPQPFLSAVAEWPSALRAFGIDMLQTVHWTVWSMSMVGRGGFEPPTSRLSSARSNQLSYQPEPR